jgi:hypothetical protein
MAGNRVEVKEEDDDNLKMNESIKSDDGMEENKEDNGEPKEEGAEE